MSDGYRIIDNPNDRVDEVKEYGAVNIVRYVRAVLVPDKRTRSGSRWQDETFYRVQLPNGGGIIVDRLTNAYAARCWADGFNAGRCIL